MEYRVGQKVKLTDYHDWISGYTNQIGTIIRINLNNEYYTIQLTITGRETIFHKSKFKLIDLSIFNELGD